MTSGEKKNKKIMTRVAERLDELEKKLEGMEDRIEARVTV